MPSLRQKDEWYVCIDENIRDLVRALHGVGVWTVFSCEGHIRSDPIYVGVYPWPWVIVQGTLREIHTLERMLGVWNDSDQVDKWILSKARMHGSLTPEYVEATFSGYVTALVPVCTNSRLSADVLSRLQDSARELSEFIKSQE
jgi:hypothetical protein